MVMRLATQCCLVGLISQFKLLCTRLRGRYGQLRLQSVEYSFDIKISSNIAKREAHCCYTSDCSKAGALKKKVERGQDGKAIGILYGTERTAKQNVILKDYQAIVLENQDEAN
ncbi:hypothetical protein CHS0354_011339, partial [Potamilus streckersoni]